MNKSSNEKNKYNLILKIMAACCFVVLAAYFICGMIVSPKFGNFYEAAQIYTEDWIRENSDGSTAVYKMPMNLSLADGEVATFHTVLPDSVEDGMYLAINTGKCFNAYIEDEEIYTFDNNISKLPGNITKTVIVSIPLKENYAGKILTLKITDGKYDRSIVNTAYIGSLMGIVVLLVKNYALQFTMAALLVIASLITIAIFAYIEKRDNRKAPLIYLAEGILLICSWIICDSPLFQLLFGAYFVDGVTGFMLVITMGFPFLMYFDAISEYRKHKIFAVFEMIIVINFIVLTILHMTGIRSYDKSLIYVDFMLLVYIIVMISCTMKDFYSRKDKSHTNVIFGLIGLAVFSFCEIVVTILCANFPFTVDIGGLCVLAGMIVLLLFATLDQVKIFGILKQETQNAIAATKAKSDFLANMSHEIRTPINAIMGMNEMVLRETNQENVKDYAKDIASASENLLDIINDILDFSKIESGKLELVCDNYDLGELIYDVTTLVNMKAEDRGLKFNVVVDEQLPSKLYGDDKRVREIVTNILNNAVKYTEKGFVTLNVNGEIEEKTVLLRIAVEDSGQGIKEEDLDKIFNGFAQVNVKKNKNIEGTGLGLSITKRLIELMEGSIDVKSEFGKGSTFVVVLPQQIASDEKMGNYMSHRHVSASATGSKIRELEIPGTKILVVDDTALNLKVISKILAKTKAEVTCAASGAEMLELIQKGRYDLILLDHMMPNMDGMEALRESKKLPDNKCENVPVIALTANAIVGAKEMYLEAGFDDYLSKPVRMDELCELLVKYTTK